MINLMKNKNYSSKYGDILVELYVVDKDDDIIIDDSSTFVENDSLNTDVVQDVHLTMN